MVVEAPLRVGEDGRAVVGGEGAKHAATRFHPLAVVVVERGAGESKGVGAGDERRRTAGPSSFHNTYSLDRLGALSFNRGGKMRIFSSYYWWASNDATQSS